MYVLCRTVYSVYVFKYLLWKLNWSPFIRIGYRQFHLIYSRIIHFNINTSVASLEARVCSVYLSPKYVLSKIVRISSADIFVFRILWKFSWLSFYFMKTFHSTRTFFPRNMKLFQMTISNDYFEWLKNEFLWIYFMSYS